MAQLENTKRRDDLVADEKKIQPIWNFISKPIQKYFITLCMPYVNGRLHLGHLYTFSKAEFYARYLRLQNKNVLFPLAWHGTGIPIASCASKISESLKNFNTNNILDLPNNNQIKILYNMGIPLSEIPKFTDPYYWLKYFPKLAEEDLKLFGISIDFSRSFVTTDLNLYFDKFIKWQFNILAEKKYLIFGKKPVIYSPKLNQACAAHDRATGEEAKITEYFVYLAKLLNKFENMELVLISELELSDIKFVTCNPETRFNIFEYSNQKLIGSAEFIRNFKYQINQEINILGDIPGSDLIGLNIKLDNNNITIMGSRPDQSDTGHINIFPNKKSDNKLISKFKYYQASDPVISRFGDPCVVAIINQWFINYSDEILKNKINNYIQNKLNCYDPEIQNMVKYGSAWLKEWPCSRSTGIGTKLLDTDYLIDSLSDSTIYMAYYTIAHKIQDIPLEYISDKLFDYIFLDRDIPDIPEKYNLLLSELRAEFKYWYGVDLRISGKDLVSNHLTMCLYNHAMIWPDQENLWPKNYYINGHILLNGEKMAKSTGLFLTLRETIEKFGADATRFVLAESGSGINDANFVELSASNAVLKLTVEKNYCKQIINLIITEPPETNPGFWDQIFLSEIYLSLKNSQKYYDILEYQKLITNIYDLLTCRDKYRNKYEHRLIKINTNILKIYLDNFLLILYPICPHLVENIWSYGESKNLKFPKLWPDTNKIQINYKNIFYKDIINNLLNISRSEIDRFIKKYIKKNPGLSPKIKLNIILYNKFSESELDIIKNLKGSDIKFLLYIKNNIKLYGEDYINYILDCEALNKILEYWIRKLLNNDNIENINISIQDKFPDNKNNPIKPKIFVNLI